MSRHNRQRRQATANTRRPAGPRPHTRLALMAEVMAEASGQPRARCKAMLADFKVVKGAPGDGPMTEAEYRSTRAELIAELPGILAWMVRGAVEAHADPGQLADFRRQAASRN